jgi:hypothetical protein
MKLGREEVQKIVLGGLIIFGVIFSYFNLLLGPLARGAKATRERITVLAGEIEAGKAQLMKTEAAERLAPEQAEVRRAMVSGIPEGAPVAWFPPRMGWFFKERGMEKVTTRMTSEVVEKELRGFRRVVWTLDFPKVGFFQFAGAIADLENAEPLLEVTQIQIDAGREEPEAQKAVLTVSHYVNL